MIKESRKIDKNFRLAIAQLNPVAGDIEGNLAKARAARIQAGERGVDLIIFPAYFISGYPLQDLWLRQGFVNKCQWAVEEFMHDTADGGPAVFLSLIPCLAGAIEFDIYSERTWKSGELNVRNTNDNKTSYILSFSDFEKERIYNHSFDKAGCYVLDGGVQCSHDDGVFDIRGLGLGLGINPEHYNQRVVERDKTQFILNIEHRPYQREQVEQRLQSARKPMEGYSNPLIYVHAFGGQDGLVFDGGSFSLQPDGSIAFQMPQFTENVYVSEWERTQFGWWCRDGEVHELYQGAAANYHACMIGLRDYVNKNGFAGVLLGLSGGVDSALCTALAVDALGAERVQTVMLPYHYTSQESLHDAQDCARRLGCSYQTIPIAAPVDDFLEALKPAFGDAPRDVTEENLQSRARGVILMALSNKFGTLLLTTGNKSESAVGYATLYGDMCGGFNPIKDLYKRDVYALCNWRNSYMPDGGLGPQGAIIPQNILDRPPSAELRPDQKDEDSLPPYPVLDAILYGLVEENKTIAAVVAQGYEREVVERVEDLLYRGEFKRQQAAPGVKISSRSFGEDWHMPITHRFRDRI